MGGNPEKILVLLATLSFVASASASTEVSKNIATSALTALLAADPTVEAPEYFGEGGKTVKLSEILAKNMLTSYQDGYVNLPEITNSCESAGRSGILNCSLMISVSSKKIKGGNYLQGNSEEEHALLIQYQVIKGKISGKIRLDIAG